MKNFSLGWFLGGAALFLVLLSQNGQAETNIDFFLRGSAAYQDVEVARVLTVDSIQLKNRERIKLIGLSGPEKPKESHADERNEYGFIIEDSAGPVIPFEEQAFDFVKNLLEGQKVRLEFDILKKDADQNTLAYVFLKENDLFVNEEILLKGYAGLSLPPPNTKYKQTLRNAYREARKEKRGLHNQ